MRDPFRPSQNPAPCFDTLEPRRLLAWGAYPQLIDQDLAAQAYPDVTGKNTAIAIIDTGVDFTHPVLADKLWVNPGEVPNDGIDNDRNGYTDDVNGYDFYRDDPKPEDENGHGTQMSGIIAGRMWSFQGSDYQGVAPDTKLIHLKVADPTGRIGDTSFARRIEEALQWVEANHARHNIVAVNLSVMVHQLDFASILKDEAARLNQAGVVLVAAGGHQGPYESLIYPAADPNVYSVGIVDSADAMSPKTQRGPDLDLLAPGKEVPIINLRSAYTVSGEATSYPTPFVTGAVALIKQVNPALSPAQVIAILKDSGAPVIDPRSGRVHSRLDLDDAIRVAKLSVPTPEPEPEPEPEPRPEPEPEPEPEPRPEPIPGGKQRPFRNKPFNVTKRIQFEHFDRGGTGVSYHEEGTTLQKNRVRNDAAVQLKRARVGWTVSSTSDGEWLEYTLSVPASGRYRLEASMIPESAAKLVFSIDGKRVAKAFNVPAKKSGKSARTPLQLERRKIQLAEGRHVLRVSIQTLSPTSSGPLLDWFRFVSEQKRKA